MQPIPGTETILIIDDDGLVLSLAQRMLRLGGYVVLTTTSGSDAIALFKNWPIEVHLLLVDLVMPGMSGPETVEQIHKLRPRLPVLFFSAYSELEYLRPRYARNIPLLTKPFNSLQLTTKIRQVLDGAYAMAAGDQGSERLAAAFPVEPASSRSV